MDREEELREIRALQAAFEDLVAHGAPSGKTRLAVAVAQLMRIEMRLEHLRHDLEDEIDAAQLVTSTRPPLSEDRMAMDGGPDAPVIPGTDDAWRSISPAPPIAGMIGERPAGSPQSASLALTAAASLWQSAGATGGALHIAA